VERLYSLIMNAFDVIVREIDNLREVFRDEESELRLLPETDYPPDFLRTRLVAYT